MQALKASAELNDAAVGPPFKNQKKSQAPRYKGQEQGQRGKMGVDTGAGPTLRRAR